MNADKDFGERVREARHQLGYSQQALADVAGLSVHTIRNVEAGRTQPSLRAMLALNRALGFGDAPATVEAVIFNVLGDYSSDLDWIDEVAAKLATAMREAGLLQ